jgi:protein-S-isoprenylcysteine O-methyltransferase Ste14
MKVTADYPPVWLAGFAGLAWGQAQVWPMAGLPTAGGVLVAAGALLMAAAAVQFARARTTIVPHETPSALVTGGVYGFSRNPIYLADAAILAGLCIVWGAWPSLVLVPVFVRVITARFIRPEEARLRAVFGRGFDDWASRVRRWV